MDLQDFVLLTVLTFIYYLVQFLKQRLKIWSGHVQYLAGTALSQYDSFFN